MELHAAAQIRHKRKLRALPFARRGDAEEARCSSLSG